MNCAAFALVQSKALVPIEIDLHLEHGRSLFAQPTTDNAAVSIANSSQPSRSVVYCVRTAADEVCGTTQCPFPTTCCYSHAGYCVRSELLKLGFQISRFQFGRPFSVTVLYGWIFYVPSHVQRLRCANSTCICHRFVWRINYTSVSEIRVSI